MDVLFAYVLVSLHGCLFLLFHVVTCPQDGAILSLLVKNLVVRVHHLY